MYIYAFKNMKNIFIKKLKKQNTDHKYIYYIYKSKRVLLDRVLSNYISRFNIINYSQLNVRYDEVMK